MSKLHLSVLGQPRIEMDGQPVEINRRKAIALLTYLAVTGELQSRDKLAGLFWPRESRERARAALRRTLTAIRQAIGGEWLVVEGESVGMNKGGELWLDVKQFDALLARYKEISAHGDSEGAESIALLTEVARLYRTDFLSQFTLDSNTDFSEWQFFQGEHLKRQFMDTLSRLVEAHACKGEHELAVVYARRRLSLDPLDESCHRSLMRLYVASGHASLALRQYRNCEKWLGKELGVQPEEATRVLFDDIKARKNVEVVEPREGGAAAAGQRPSRGAKGAAIGRTRRARVTRIGLAVGGVVLVAAITLGAWAILRAAPRRVSVAVLPFEARSVEGRDTALLEGMTDALIAELSGVPGLDVKSLLAVADYRGVVRPAAEIGRELDVAWVVSGSVLVSGSTLRVSVHLVRAATDMTAWAAVYERDSRDVVRVEGEVAASAAAAIKQQLGRD